MSSAMLFIVFFFVVLPLSIWLFFFIYFLPYKIAKDRNAAHSGIILFFNIFFGITVIGWLFVFLWALLDEREIQKARAMPYWQGDN